MKNFMILLILFFTLITTFTHSQGQVIWARRFGQVATWDIPHVVKPDNVGNIYVTGFFGLTTNNGKLPLIKYNINGDTIWSSVFTTPDNSNTSGTQLLLDDSLNIYISGRYLLKYKPSGELLYSRYYNCTTNKMSFDSTNNFVYGGTNQNGVPGCAILKCNRNGDSLWKKVYPFFVEEVKGLAVDRQNNIIITSRVYSGSATDRDFLTIKFDTNGNILWYKTYHGGDPTEGFDDPCGILLDSADNIIVSGTSNGPAGGSNYYTVKYSPSGDVIWEARYPLGASGSTDMEIDKNGNIYICGITGNNSYSTLKYNSVGTLLWIQTVPGVSLPPDNSLTLDSAGNIYMACSLASSEGGSGYQVVKYNSNGNLLWNVVYPGSGPGVFYSTDIAVDRSGNVFVTGEASGNAYDFLTIRINQTSGVIQNISGLPAYFSLSQNYPNPFNPTTKISYSLKKSANIELRLFDVNGKLLKILESGNRHVGSNSINLSSENLASGIYFYSLFADGVMIDTKKAIILK